MSPSSIFFEFHCVSHLRHPMIHALCMPFDPRRNLLTGSESQSDWQDWGFFLHQTSGYWHLGMVWWWELWWHFNRSNNTASWIHPWICKTQWVTTRAVYGWGHSMSSWGYHTCNWTSRKAGYSLLLTWTHIQVCRCRHLKSFAQMV